MVDAESKATKTPEIEAFEIVYTALKELDGSAQSRVLRYVAEMLSIEISTPKAGATVVEHTDTEHEDVSRPKVNATDKDVESDGDETAGISGVALRWLKRSDLSAANLQSLFSLGLDEIDLVARSVPGDSKKERMRSVLLLRGIASYLGTGVARFTYEQFKESCIHYNGFDSANFATYLKSFSADVGGNKKTGFTLSARGLTEATDLIKRMLSSS